MQSQSEMPLVRDGLVESWWTECVEYWQRLPNRSLFLWLMAAWLLLFHFLGNGTLGYTYTASLLKWMFISYNSDSEIADDAHGNFIPLVVLGLFWWKRKELFAENLRSWAPALLIILAAALLHVAAYMVQQARVSVLAMLLGIYGIMGLAWGPGWLRRSVFPFVLMVFLVPLGSKTEIITFPLRMLVTVLVEFVAGTIFGMDVVRVGTGLFDSAQTFQFDVAPACSGIRSLVAIFLICTAYGYVAYRCSWRWLVMILAAFPLAVLGNMVRLLLIIVSASWFGQETGSNVHDNPFFSMVPYVPAVLGVIYLERGLNRLHAAIQAENSKR